MPLPKILSFLTKKNERTSVIKVNKVTGAPQAGPSVPDKFKIVKKKIKDAQKESDEKKEREKWKNILNTTVPAPRGNKVEVNNKNPLNAETQPGPSSRFILINSHNRLEPTPHIEPHKAPTPEVLSTLKRVTSPLLPMHSNATTYAQIKLAQVLVSSTVELTETKSPVDKKFAAQANGLPLMPLMLQETKVSESVKYPPIYITGILQAPPVPPRTYFTLNSKVNLEQVEFRTPPPLVPPRTKSLFQNGALPVITENVQQVNPFTTTKQTNIQDSAKEAEAEEANRLANIEADKKEAARSAAEAAYAAIADEVKDSFVGFANGSSIPIVEAKEAKEANEAENPLSAFTNENFHNSTGVTDTFGPLFRDNSVKNKNEEIKDNSYPNRRVPLKDNSYANRRVPQ